MEQAATTTELNRQEGFGKNIVSANSAYKQYVAGVPQEQTPLAFKAWLTEQQSQGNFLNTNKVNRHGWKQEPILSSSAPSQPNLSNTATAPAEPVTTASAVAKTADAPWRPLGMHPLLAGAVVATVIYLGVKFLK